MKDVLQGVSTLCVVLIATGALAQLCPQDKMVGFVRGVIVLVLLCSTASALFSLDWRLPQGQVQAQAAQGRLTEFINSQYVSATEEEAARTITGLLGAAGLTPKKILVKADSLEGSGIVCTKVSVSFAYPADSERAYALLHNVLGDGVEIEVKTDGS